MPESQKAEAELSGTDVAGSKEAMAEETLKAPGSSSPMVRRKVVRAATELGADYWLREQKGSLPVADPWLRRALIASSSAFGKDERKYWLQRVDKEATSLEKIVIRWVKG